MQQHDWPLVVSVKMELATSTSLDQPSGQNAVDSSKAHISFCSCPDYLFLRLTLMDYNIS